MDEDTALRALGEELTRDSPLLAAALTGPVPVPRRHRLRWLLVALAVLTLAALAPLTVFLGMLGVLLVAASPVLVCCACAISESDGGLHPG